MTSSSVSSSGCGSQARPSGGHAVGAAQVAPVGQRDPQVGGDPAVAVDEPRHGRRAARSSSPTELAPPIARHRGRQRPLSRRGVTPAVQHRGASSTASRYAAPKGAVCTSSRWSWCSGTRCPPAVGQRIHLVVAPRDPVQVRRAAEERQLGQVGLPVAAVRRRVDQPGPAVGGPEHVARPQVAVHPGRRLRPLRRTRRCRRCSRSMSATSAASSAPRSAEHAAGRERAGARRTRTATGPGTGCCPAAAGR